MIMGWCALRWLRWISLTLGFVTSVVHGTAQTTTRWAFGIGGGPIYYQGDVSKDGFGTFRGNTTSGYFTVQRQWSPYWATAISVNHGQLKADDNFYPEDPFRLDRQFSFSTTYTDVAVLMHFYPLRHLRLRPSVALGIGKVFWDAEPDITNTDNKEILDRALLDLAANYERKAWILPFQVDLTYELSSSFAVKVGWQLNFTDTDYLDGVSIAGNENNNDRYGSIFLSAAIQMGKVADFDKDGIVDSADDCPFKPGFSRTNGCPDNDLDGIRDSADRCPYAAGSINAHGCPDTDNDGTPDPYDRCPAEAGPIEALGCPKVDTDRDGIEDHMDDCPLIEGPKHRRGCPAIDTDRDGILDEDDACPTIYGPVLFNGCPDTDGDGVEDAKDACPAVFGAYIAQGCPETTTPQEEAQLLNMQMLNFPANSAQLSNYALLDKIKQFLLEYPYYSLKIKGHSDGSGSDQHASISSERAQAVARYLQIEGVMAERMQIESLGAQYPLNTSSSFDGQAQNRRVDFVLEPVN